MRDILSLCVLVTAGLTACGGDSHPDGGSEAGPETQAAVEAPAAPGAGGPLGPVPVPAENRPDSHSGSRPRPQSYEAHLYQPGCRHQK